MERKRTWKGGRKKLTPEQLKVAKAVQHERVRITNLVARKPEINKNCCICGKPNSPIFHNPDNLNNPYMITFLCWDCRKDPQKVLEAENHREDIRNKISKSNIYTRNITDEEVIRIIEGYAVNNVICTIEEYCKRNDISRYQFSKLLERYTKIKPNKPMTHKIKNKIKTIKNEQLRKSHSDSLV